MEFKLTLRLLSNTLAMGTPHSGVNEHNKKAKYSINKYSYYFTCYKFFTPALAGGLSLECERQQVSSGLFFAHSAEAVEYTDCFSVEG